MQPGDEEPGPVTLVPGGGRRNTWLVGDGREVIVVDAVGDPDVILAVVDGRRVVAVVCTTDPQGNQSVVDVGARAGAPVWTRPEIGQEFTVAGVTLQALRAPGFHPGVCLYSPTLGCVFTGDADVVALDLPSDTVVHTG